MNVEFAPRARSQVRQIDQWWRQKRPAAPTLFADELASAIETMAGGVLLGVVYSFALFDVRRLLLPRSRYHVFYSFDGDCVRIRAVWHASRGQGPPLR